MNHQEIFDKEFLQTGERWLVERLASGNIQTVFDVGSNRGEWTRMARRAWPTATIHTFEVVSPVYHALLNNGVVDSRVVPNSFGLADEIKMVDLKYVSDIDTISTMVPDLLPGTMDIPYKMISGFVVTGDMYTKSREIKNIDFLKIDVEGAEDLVLKGFKNTLESGQIGMIQFEFGTANIISKFLLIDYYKLLTPLNFVVGKLTGQGLGFKNYSLTDETFHGYTGIAVHRSRQDLLDLLK